MALQDIPQSNTPSRKIRFAFFGTPELALIVLDTLKEHELLPTYVITQPDKPVGRKLLITPPPVKTWALREGCKVLQPEKMNDPVFLKELADAELDVFIVFAYGKIIPESVLALSKHGALNIHPSLLPKWRGPSPLEATLTHDDKNAGVSLMLMDKEMDHGPIIKAQHVTFDPWPPSKDTLAHTLVHTGALLLTEVIYDFIDGKIIPQEQDHAQATYTAKITKEDGLLNLNDDAYSNYLKYLAYKEWPSTYFLISKDGKEIRVKISEAEFNNNSFIIKKVIPEGKSEMDYIQFRQHYL